MDFHVGQTFGDYSITSILGAGAMGHVYKVEHLLTKRVEAMKVLIAELASDVQIKRFEREMRVLARLTHPNIAGLHNAVHSDKRLILFMEFVDGRTLESMLIAGRLPLNTGIRYIRQILLALEYAHQQGVVHRDVTPANVMITAADEVKLTDFGLSKSFGDSLLTNCGEILGALPYLAPEQLKGTTQPDRRSDIYAVGAILYEHLTGKKPFGPNRRLAAVLTDTEDEPVPPSQLDPGLSPQWDQVVGCALARDPGRRYQSAADFLEAIARLHSPPGAEHSLPQLRTVGIGVAVLAGLLLALIAPRFMNRITPAAQTIAPWKLHVAPPEFASLKTPSGAPEFKPVTPRPVRAVAALHRKRPAPAVAVNLAEPRPPVKTIILMKTPAAALAAPVSSPESIASPPPPIVDIQQPVAVAPAEPASSQSVPPRKKGFWNKLNVFKKKKGADQNEKQ